MADDFNENQGQDIVYALAASPDFARSGVCFAARHSGLSRSDDGGLTWKSLFDTLRLENPLLATGVALSPNFPSDRHLLVGVPGGILRSVDGGKTWETIALPPPPPFISALAVSPNYGDDDIVFAGTMEDGIFRSADRGVHWAAWNFGLFDLNVLCIAISPGFAQDETLFVGTDSGIFRSQNGGRAWRAVDFSSDLAPVLSLAISPAFVQDGVLFAGTESHGLFCSGDRGQTWQPVTSLQVSGPINAVLLSPDYPDKRHLLAMSNDALLVSRTGGRTWSSWCAKKFEASLSSVFAPEKLGRGAPLLVGLSDGRVLRI